MYAMYKTEVMQEVVQPPRRRRHCKEFKATHVIRAAMQPNVSIAAVAPAV
jgi:transposase-like protein